MYYNTTSLINPELQDKWDKCKKQDDRVLVLMSRMRRATASEVWREFKRMLIMESPPPITSIRRSLSSWSSKGNMRRTKEKKPGIYGDPEHYYEFIHSKLIK